MSIFQRQFRHVLLVVLTVAIIAAVPSLAESTDHQKIADKVWIDAHVAERVAEASGGSLPADLLGTIVDEDIDLLRGRRPNSTYEWAHFEKIEVGRITQGTTVNAGTKEHADRAEIRGRHVFRIIVKIPSRRQIVRRNPPVNVTRIDFDYTNESGDKKFQSITPDALIPPGGEKAWDLPEIASDVVATVWARSTGEASNLELTLVRAQLFDDTEGPFFGALQSAKLLKTAIERKDAESTRTAAETLADRLQTMRGGAPATEPSEAATEGPTVPSPSDIYFQLQKIEDLLTGSDSERREGLDQLHQLVRTLRHAILH